MSAIPGLQFQLEDKARNRRGSTYAIDWIPNSPRTGSNPFVTRRGI